MHVRVRVGDLGIRQWNYLKNHLPDSYPIGPDHVRMCVEFEFPWEDAVKHVEMPVHAFAAMMARLQLADHCEDCAVTSSQLFSPAEISDRWYPR